MPLNMFVSFKTWYIWPGSDIVWLGQYGLKTWNVYSINLIQSARWYWRLYLRSPEPTQLQTTLYICLFNHWEEYNLPEWDSREVRQITFVSFSSNIVFYPPSQLLGSHSVPVIIFSPSSSASIQLKLILSGACQWPENISQMKRIISSLEEISIFNAGSPS